MGRLWLPPALSHTGLLPWGAPKREGALAGGVQALLPAPPRRRPMTPKPRPRPCPCVPNPVAPLCQLYPAKDSPAVPSSSCICPLCCVTQGRPLPSLGLNPFLWERRRVGWGVGTGSSGAIHGKGQASLSCHRPRPLPCAHPLASPQALAEGGGWDQPVGDARVKEAGGDTPRGLTITYSRWGLMCPLIPRSWPGAMSDGGRLREPLSLTLWGWGPTGCADPCTGAGLTAGGN